MAIKGKPKSRLINNPVNIQTVSGYSKYDSELREYRKQAITAAKELCYPAVVIQELKEASSVARIESILNAARHKYFK